MSDEQQRKQQQEALEKALKALNDAGKPVTIFGGLFGGNASTSEYLQALKAAQDFLNASEQEEQRRLRQLLCSEPPLNDWTN